jgi:hypothetical protein
MASRVDKDQAVSRPERADVATLEPIFHALHDSMLKHQGRAGAFHHVVDSDAAIIRVWHFSLRVPWIQSGVTIRSPTISSRVSTRIHSSTTHSAVIARSEATEQIPMTVRSVMGIASLRSQ